MAAIGMHNFVFPGQSVGSLYQILHVGIRAILCPPGHGDIAPMAKLIDIVFHGPVFAGFTHQVGS